ncbi:MAG TPA: substrate-binding domain-containing protein [Solirubrobacteraceae bacterium]|nr:substrate-binding domain-containing protein [Solirubrobacteraceae bacterium]
MEVAGEVRTVLDREGGGIEMTVEIRDAFEVVAVSLRAQIVLRRTPRAPPARGIRVPEQLSIVGLYDTFEASIVTPALTTVRQPLAEMGRIAVNQLIRLLSGERIEALHVELATKLTVRE